MANNGLLAMSSSTSGIQGAESPLPSVADSDVNDANINLQIFVPELQIQVGFFRI